MPSNDPNPAIFPFFGMHYDMLRGNEAQVSRGGTVQQLAVIIVEPSQIVANIIRKSLEASEFRCIVMRDPATFAATLHTLEDIGLVLLDVLATMADDAGRDRPLWQILSEQGPQPVPVLCFNGTNSTPSDTPLFTAPPDTMTIAAPSDFVTVARVIQASLQLLQRQPLLREALAGSLRPSLHGLLSEFSLEGLLKMIQMGEHSGVLVLRDGLSTGLVACEKGQVVHATIGALARKEAIFTLFKWRTANFAFFRHLELGEHTISHSIESLILEANRLEDEVTDLASFLPPSAYVQRVRGYADLLPGKEFSRNELEVLAAIDHYHIVHDLINRFPNYGEIVVMKALRALWQKELIEVAPLGDPRYLLAEHAS